MPVIWISTLLQDLTHGANKVTVPGETVLQVIDSLEERYPGIKGRLCEGNRLRANIAVIVDGAISQQRLLHKLSENSQVRFMPAISGGCIDVEENVQRFTGFADVYDQYRPHPPARLAEILHHLAQTDRPELVVDLGCGAGLSTRYWAEKSRLVIGVDPSPDMLRQAWQQGYIVLHYLEEGNAARLVGVLRSQGSTAGLIKKGITEQELGIDRLRATAQRTLGEKPSIWYWSSRLRIGIV